ncbi:MAG: hypothetical protein HGB05_18580, partial [Chloroflexi bacterium]|nr:hypothetical protein [Chloroflexota bacterium]
MRRRQCGTLIVYSTASQSAMQASSGVGAITALTVAAHNSLCANHIFAMGSEAQKRRYLVPLASGQMIGAWALTEP